jgi:flavin-dependent dehydrogenase
MGDAVLRHVSSADADGGGLVMYDIIIIGARCAGSPTAMLLARKGYRALLVDRASFPSDTISTHFIQRPGIAHLKSWGLLDKLKATGCPPVRKLIKSWGLRDKLAVGTPSLRTPSASSEDADGVSLTFCPTPSDDLAEGYVPRRKIIDRILADMAVEAGAELRTGFSVRDIVRDGDRVIGIRGRQRNGVTVTEHARLVIGADGMRSMLARAVQAPVYRAKPTLTCFYYSYWSGVRLEGAETYRIGRRAITAMPTHDGLACITAICPREWLAEFRADIEGNYLKTIGLNPDLAERVSQGRREERIVGAADLPNFFRKPYGPGWALVGDAGCHKDPFLGLGISDAFRDAELLAAAIDDGFSERRPLDEALAEYERQRNEAVTESYEAACKAAALPSVTPRTIEFMAALKENPVEVDRFFRIGKEVPSSEFYSAENLRRILGADRFIRVFTKRKTDQPKLLSQRQEAAPAWPNTGEVCRAQAQ